MTLTEPGTVRVLNKELQMNLLLVDTMYNSYDAEDEIYICEIKNRRKLIMYISASASRDDGVSELIYK